VIVLHSGHARCAIDPVLGGRIASLAVAGRELLVPGGADADPMQWGSYPMVPWAGRIREGRFSHAGRDLAMPQNLGDHAIHGVGFTSAWDIVTPADVTGHTATIRLDLGSPWPFGGSSQQHFELSANRVVCDLSVTAGAVAMPAQVGWHPWFVKPASAQLRLAAMYQRDDAGIPTGELVEPPPGPWDDCFVRPLAPLQLRYDDLEVTIDSDCDHWVVYDQPLHATCVEPQSGPPDGFTLNPRVLRPGETLARRMTISWREIGQALA